MNLYYNTVREKASNTLYPRCKTISSIDDLKEVVSHDHVCALYKDNRRKKDNFVQADCTMLDIDNTDSDDESKWITPADIAKAFKNVRFFIVYSRNHMKSKDGRKPRPKFHVYFHHKIISDLKEYEKLKNDVCNYFPAFDDNAKDAARFFFGVQNPQIEYFKGNITLTDFMDKRSICSTEEKSSVTLPTKNTFIPQGQRNTSLHRFACRVLTRQGNNDTAYQSFIEESKKCKPPLGQKELNSIWKSAYKYYMEHIQNSSDYIPPKQYSKTAVAPNLKPDDFTDLGQAKVFYKEYGEKLRYSLATGFLFYTGRVWKEGTLKAQGFAQELTERQLKEVTLLLRKVQNDENNAALNNDSSARKEADNTEKNIKQYRRFILKNRDSQRISAVLKEIQPSIEISTDELDTDGFLLNTPVGTIDLKSKRIHPHNPNAYCTKITAVRPSDKGKELFMNFLKNITCEDSELQEYLQLVVGMCAIGKVFCENLIIAYGTGKNGKSTFFNLLAQVLGDYSGSLSAETLTSECRKNKSPEYAELCGKRLVISSELEDDTSLNTAIMKKLCSTDRIYAEKKYKAPFDFKPTHTLILCTNHLPRIYTSDNGTWRRIIIIPFHAVIENSTEMKNYADYLFENAGEAVLSWIIEGAEKFINTNYNLIQPKCVQQAIDNYRNENDWLHNYLSERCEIGKEFTQQSGKLYHDYRNYCKDTGTPTKNNATFNRAIQNAGFMTKKTNKGKFIYGLKLLPFDNFQLPVMTSDREFETFTEEEVVF